MAVRQEAPFLFFRVYLNYSQRKAHAFRCALRVYLNFYSAGRMCYFWTYPICSVCRHAHDALNGVFPVLRSPTQYCSSHNIRHRFHHNGSRSNLPHYNNRQELPPGPQQALLWELLPAPPWELLPAPLWEPPSAAWPEPPLGPMRTPQTG